MNYEIPQHPMIDSVRSIVNAVKYAPEEGVSQNVVSIDGPLDSLSIGVLSAIEKTLEDKPSHVEFKHKATGLPVLLSEVRSAVDAKRR